MTDVTLPALGVLIAGSLASLIAVVVLYRLVPFVVVCLFGQKATGRVVRVEAGEKRQARLRISFVVADGREVEYREIFLVKAKVGEHLPVRYSRKNPDLATSSRLWLVLRDFFSFGIVLGVLGLLSVASSIYVLVTGTHRVFYSVVSPCFFASMAFIFLYLAALHCSKARSWHRRVVADGVVTRLAPTKRENEYPHPWVSYATQDGRRLEYRDIALNGYAPGDDIAVYYDPDYPELTVTGVDKAGNAGQAVFYGVVGLMFLAGAISFFWS
jgi:hypothetical protein